MQDSCRFAPRRGWSDEGYRARLKDPTLYWFWDSPSPARGMSVSLPAC
jgi:hypothetical protein